MIDLQDISKVYQVGEERVRALNHVTMHIYPKEFVSIIGPSGSGKSTLMNIIGCLDTADAGIYRLDGIPIGDYSENQLARVRNQKIGFIFQNFNLISKLSADGRRWSGWAWPSARSICPRSSPEASSSVWRSPAPW